MLLASAADADSTGDVHLDVHGGPDAHSGHDTDQVGAFLAMFLSLRFWIFALLAFGIVGTPLHFLHLAGPLLTLVLSLSMGFASGFVAAWAVRALSRADAGSSYGEADAVGKVGRVLLPCSKTTRGKVRIELRGQTLDYLATTDEDELAVGTSVLVEEARDGSLHVSRAPRDLLPENGQPKG
jgi:membrane protein implicated in regulation of membrane protease activity